MDTNRHIWQNWVDPLHRWGLNDLVASILEVFHPLSFFAAQVVYVSEPLLNGIISQDKVQTLAAFLEDDLEVNKFVNHLREERLS